jgi:type I restriction enzyme S subunit
MAVWSEIRSGELTKPSRIDAEYFRPIYLSAQKKLRQYKPLLYYVKQVTHPAEFERVYSDSGWPVLRAQNIRPLCIDTDSNIVFLPESIATTLSKNQAQFCDIFITRTGANYGQTALYTGECEKAVVTSHTLIVRAKEANQAPYLALFLNTSLGRLMIDQGMYGSTHPEIAPRFIRDIPVPRFGTKVESDLSKTVLEAYKLRKNSELLYAQAKQLLEQELGLDTIQKDNRVTNEVRLAEAVLCHRFDAQCFKPEYLQYELVLREMKNYISLHEAISTFSKGQQQADVNNGNIDYVSIKDISRGEVIASSKCHFRSNLVAADKEDILLAVTGATIGKIGMNCRYERLAFCGDLVALKTRKTVNPYYLLRVLDSDIAKTQFQRWITGSTNGHLSATDIAKVIVPRLSPAKEEIIAEMVQQSFINKGQSETLLSKAKSRLEELIEQGVN